MAIKPSVVYNGQVDVSNLVTYPWGAAQNDLVDGDGFGTPLEKTWVSDVWGFLQSLLKRAGIEPSGVPDTAIVSQYSDGVKFVAQTAHAVFFARNYGAKGDLSTNDSSAINDAIQACSTAGGGVVIFDAGDYMLSSTVVVLPHVSLQGRGRVVWWANQPSAPVVEFSGTPAITQRISGIQFEGAVVNNAALFRSPTGITVDFVIEDCKVNKADDKLRGNILSNDSSSFSFVECEFDFKKIATTGLQSGGGHLKLTRCSLSNITLSSYNSFLVSQTAGELTVTGCVFDMSGSGSTPTGVWIGASTIASVIGNRFTSNAGPLAVQWAAGALFEIDSNTFSGSITPYGAAGTGHDKSHLGPTPAVTLTVSGPSTVYIAQSASSVYIRSTHSAAPSILFEGPPLCAGFRREVFILNDSSALWSSPLTISGASYSAETAIDDIPILGWVSAVFTSLKGQSSIFWAQIGGWARTPATT